MPFPDPGGPPPAVVRFPVAGPAPFTTLAVFSHRASGVLVTHFPDLLRFRLTQLTPLTINGFDPGRPEQRRCVHSCMAVVHRMTADDSATFVLAADEIAHPDPAGAIPVEVTGAAFDDHGHWSVQLDIAQACDADTFSWSVELRCWVLFVESTPPEPETPDQTLARAQALAAAQRLAAYRHYLGLSGADLAQAAAELVPLASTLARGAYAVQALEAQQLVVDALQGVDPAGPDARRDHLLELAEARHNLIARLVDTGQVDRAVGLVGATLGGYREYADLAGADLVRVGRDLRELSAILTKPAHRPVDALPVQQLCVDVVGRLAPVPGDHGAHQITLAEVRHDLIARLVDAARADEQAGAHATAAARIERVVALAGVTITGYRLYLHRPDSAADHDRARGELTELAGILAAAGLSDLAQQALAAADPG